MSEDVNVKDIDALYGFASNVIDSGSNIGSICSNIHSAIYNAEREQRVYVDRIESALQKAENDLNQSIQEYDDYIFYSDEDSYDEYYAESLRADVKRAEDWYYEVKEDLDSAQSIFLDTKTRLSNLIALTDSFSLIYLSIANKVSNKIKTLAYQVSQYKDAK